MTFAEFNPDMEFWLDGKRYRCTDTLSGYIYHTENGRKVHDGSKHEIVRAVPLDGSTECGTFFYGNKLTEASRVQ